MNDNTSLQVLLLYGFIIGLLVTSVYVGNYAIDVRSAQGDHILRVRDDHKQIYRPVRDYKFKILRQNQNLEDDRIRREMATEQLEELESKLTKESYIRKKQERRRRGFTTLTPETYFGGKLINRDGILRRIERLDENIAQGESNLADLKVRLEKAKEIAEVKAAQHKAAHAYELNPNVDPHNVINIWYYIQAVATLVMTLCFCFLFQMSTGLRIIAGTIALISGIKHVTGRTNR